MKHLGLLFFFILLVFCACDSGNILDKEIAVKRSGKVVKLIANVSGNSHWDNTYTLALAAFADGNKYAITQRVMPQVSTDGQRISVTLENLSPQIKTVELAITDKLRKRILTLALLDMDDLEYMGDTLLMNLGDIRLDLDGCIQRGVFDVACVQCHGANGHAAAGLDLVYNMPKKEKLKQIVEDGGATTLHYNHTDVLSSHFKENLEEVKHLLYDWIETGE